MRNVHVSWTVIHIPHGRENAERIQRTLEDEGFIVRLRPALTSAGAQEDYEVLTISSEAGEARQLLLSKGLLR